MHIDRNQEAFFELVRAGLWPNDNLNLNDNHVSFKDVDWEAVYNLASEQSVVGLVAAGMENVDVDLDLDVDHNANIPLELKLQIIGEALQIEQQNKEMNGFVARLIDKLREEDVYAVLVKGQGIAQCYERPLWRSSGDVDLLLSEDNYKKAKEVLEKIADSAERETAKNTERQHQEYQISGWTVELHGTMHANLSRRTDREIDQVQREVFFAGKVRSEEFKSSHPTRGIRRAKPGASSSNGSSVPVFLPAPDEDVIFVFTHILQHLFLEGIGLRQICDWCRLLYTYREKLDLRLLEDRIRRMGLMTEWRVFAALAVQYLGMPVEAMPIFGSSVQEFKGKAERLMDFVMEVGNFGHNREVEWSDGFKRRTSLIWHRITDTIKLSRVFPVDAPKFLMNYVLDGARGLIKRN